MSSTTRGVLLSRRPLGEYNEQLSFYTEDRGAISMMSFGTRSPRSRRAALLAGYDWLTLGLAQDKGGTRLEHLALWQKNPFTESEAGASHFLACLKIARSLTEGHDPARFEALRLSWREECLGQAPQRLRFLFLHSLLCLDGRAPSFENPSIPLSWDVRSGAFVPGALARTPARLGRGEMELFNGLYEGFELSTPSFQSRLKRSEALEIGRLEPLIALCELMLQTP